eukprot:CAMPEP_0180391446 /NCGR_PEP_ID=MMETSP0989-20121125/32582_1 /TAXON_ID=697907 /ORGANISM="non described non described, Strain CCMP2293" /LENGTH=398 /DNA_ID=CAMNT_0022392987 /DNA_START=33 /DNA_END=1225 /DNA_ORIENTATION=-
MERLLEKQQDLPKQQNRRRKELARYFEETRRQLISLLALIRWQQTHLHVTRQCEDLIASLQLHQGHMHDTSSRLCLAAQDMAHQYRAPMYDVRTAVDVLATGTYRMLPDMDIRAILPPKISDKERAALLEQLDFLLRTELLRLQIPPELSRIEVKGGRLILGSDDEFEITLSLKLHAPGRPFRVDSVQLMVRAEGASLPQTEWLGPLLESRMSGSSQPLVEAVNILSDAVRIRTWQLLHAQALSSGRVPRTEVQAPPSGSSVFIYYWQDSPVLSFEALMAPDVRRRTASPPSSSAAAAKPAGCVPCLRRGPRGAVARAGEAPPGAGGRQRASQGGPCRPDKAEPGCAAGLDDRAPLQVSPRAPRPGAFDTRSRDPPAARGDHHPPSAWGVGADGAPDG